MSLMKAKGIALRKNMIYLWNHWCINNRIKERKRAILVNLRSILPGVAPAFLFAQATGDWERRGSIDYSRMTPAQIEQSVQEGIQTNASVNPETVQRALSDGMSALIGIETRVKTDSTIVNHPGIGLDTAHDAYIGFVKGEVDMETAGRLMAEAIRTVMQTQALTETETSQLKGVLAEIVGDASLADAYMAKERANVGNAPDSKVDIREGAKDNRGIKPPNPLDNAKVHTYKRLQTIIEEEGIDVNDFAALLDADRVLTPAEKALIKRIRQKIGTPKKGTVMQKVVPESDIQEILSGRYETVRKSVARASDVSKLNTLAEIYYGLRLDFDDHTFTFNDKTYGRIRYVVEDESGLDFSIDVSDYKYPYTGRGFLGTDKVIVPEYMQVEATYLDGSIFEIVDAVTGEVAQTYVFDKNQNIWKLK